MLSDRKERGGLEEWNMFPYHYDIPTGWYCHNNTNVKKDGKIKDEGVYSARMSAIEKGTTARIDQMPWRKSANPI